MKVFSKLARKITSLEQFIEEPRQFALRRQGVQLDIYRKLHQEWLCSMGIETILDIGANIGQFALAAHAAFPSARIYSFEPLPECYQQLVARLYGVRTFTAFNLGVGEKSGSLEFEHNAFSPSSSFLKMTPTHTSEFPHTRDVQIVTVKIERLDDAVAGMELRKPLLIKIDVQGYEDKVIVGGEKTIQRADLLIVESSFEALYDGQPLFDDVYRMLTAWGFTYKGSLEQISSAKDGRPLQADGIFVRRERIGGP